MNNAKMWLVVKPTVGIPLFLSAVAIGSFAVHVAVLTNTSWVGDFLQGKPLGSGDRMSTLVLPEDGTASAKASHAVDPGAVGQEITIVLPDGTVTRAIIAPPETLASATGRDGVPITQ
jgi:light-harvesting protein B-800-850 alpha chain